MRGPTLTSCTLWTAALISVVRAGPVAFTAGHFMHSTFPRQSSPNCLHATMQQQSTLRLPDSAKKTQHDSVDKNERQGPRQTWVKQSRVLKTVGPFSRSLEDIQYLTSVFAFIGRNVASKAISEGVNPVSLRMSSVYLPRIMSLVWSPFPVTVEEGTEMVRRNGATGKMERKGAEFCEGCAQRMSFLILEDLSNIRKGVYPIPSELRLENQVSAAEIKNVATSFSFGATVYMGEPSSISTQTSELERLSAGLDLPHYYQHDFHSIPGGFLNPGHAPVYDSLSELVFAGAHRMGRRMMLKPIYNEIKARGPTGKAGSGLKLLDLGTGTASFLVQAQEAFPALELHGIDLSPAMLDFGRESLSTHPSILSATAPHPTLIRANMEEVPAEDASFEFVTHSNCFHEMPEEAIRQTMKEVMRVLKPGGLFVHMDAVQQEDDAAQAATSRAAFDAKFIEPYMMSWMSDVNMDEIATSAGLVATGPAQPYFVSALRVYRRPF